MAFLLSKRFTNTICANSSFLKSISIFPSGISRTINTTNYGNLYSTKAVPTYYDRPYSKPSLVPEQLSQKKFDYSERKSLSKRTFLNDKHESESLLFVSDPDDFGVISRTNEMFIDENCENDEDDKKEQDFLENIPLRLQKLSTKQYSDIIKNHIENKRIKEAIDVLEVRMCKQDRVKPESYIYNLLIGGCAEVGYTKKAFMLFNDMKKRALKVSGGIYTSLFNACANSPWKEDGLQRATQLRSLMLVKGVEPNLTNYNSMIKAFGRCGDLATAFEIVDEMCSKNIKIRVHTFNFLLQSCISDKEAGFRHALITWRKMLSKRERPNIYSFNLMLRCIKECGLGNHETGRNVINEVLSNTSMKLLNINKVNVHKDTCTNTRLEAPNISNVPTVSEKVVCDNRMEVYEYSPNPLDIISHNQIPNFLSLSPQINGVISIGKINTPEDRLMIAGGAEGFLNEMKSYKVTPNIKTVTQLLSIQPSTLEAEQGLLNDLKLNKIKTDINFFNVLIKKRCYRFDYDSAKDVRKLIEEENNIRGRKPFCKNSSLIRMDIVTYGVLALCCSDKLSARDLIEEMNSKKLRINSEIMGSLLRQAISKWDVDFILYVLETTKDKMIFVNDVFMSHLRKFEESCQKLLRRETKDPLQKKTQEACRMFLQSLQTWIKDMETKKQEEPDHPWTQFRVNQPETFQRPSNVHDKNKMMYKKPYRKIPQYKVKA